MAEEQPKSKEEIEFQEWLDHPVTRKFRNMLRRKRYGLMEQWAAGTFTTGDQYTSSMKNVEALAICGIVEELLELEFNQLEDEE